MEKIVKNKGGRPKGSVSEATKIGIELRKKLAQAVQKRWKEIEQANFSLALGHYQEKTVGDDEVIVYKTPPDPTMLKYLGDQVIGKAKDTLEIDNPNENQGLKEINDKLKSMYINVKSKRTTKKNTD